VQQVAIYQLLRLQICTFQIIQTINTFTFKVLIHTNRSTVLMCFLWITARVLGELEEYCNLETYSPECWKNEVIVIDEAVYGRRHTGKCITAEDVYPEIADNPFYLGCSADVLLLLDSKCSGRQNCEVRVPDAELERTKPCLKDLKMFLEVRHHCVESNVLCSYIALCSSCAFGMNIN